MPPASPLVRAATNPASLEGTMVDPAIIQQQAYDQMIQGLAQAQSEAEANYTQRQGLADATMNQYVQAAQEPQYQPMSGASVIPLAAANFADQINRNDSASKAAYGELEAQRTDMLRRRQATLQKLMVQYDQQAKSAERTGQFAESLKQNQKVISLTKSYEATIDALDKISARGAEADRRRHEEQLQGERLKQESSLQGERLKHEDWRTRYTQDQESLRARVAGSLEKSPLATNPIAKAEVEAALKEYQAAVQPLSEQMGFSLGASDNDQTRAKRDLLRQGMNTALATFQARVADIEKRYSIPNPGAQQPEAPPAPKVTAAQVLDHLATSDKVTSMLGFNRWANTPAAQNLTVSALAELRAEAEKRFVRNAPARKFYRAPAGDKDTGR